MAESGSPEVMVSLAEWSAGVSDQATGSGQWCCGGGRQEPRSDCLSGLRASGSPRLNGLLTGPQVEASSPLPHNVPAFGNKGFREITNRKRSHMCDWCLYRKGSLGHVKDQKEMLLRREAAAGPVDACFSCFGSQHCEKVRWSWLRHLICGRMDALRAPANEST